MKVNLRTTIGLLLTAGLCALYATLPFIGAVSLVNVAVRLLVFFPLFIVIIFVLYKIFPTLITKLHCPKIEKLLYDSWSDRRFVMILWAILLVCWTPTYLAYFPGIFGYDAPNQMQQILGLIPISAHHPLTHTAILGVFLEGGKLLFGDYNSGVAAFCLMQGIAVTGSIAYAFLLMKMKKTPFPIMIVCFLGCVFHPLLQVLAFNTTKDILFGVVFLHFTIRCYLWLTKQEEKTKKDMFWLIFWGIMTCLLRNQGKYIVLVLLVLCLLICRKERKFFISLGTVVIISQLFFTISTNVFGVVKTDVREMLSIPIQQMAFVCSQHMEDGDVNITQEEFDKFTMLVDVEHIPNYSQETADPIKNNFKTEVMKQDLWGYLKLYFSVGLKNPGYYLMAIRNMIYPYWNMPMNQYVFLTVENTFPHLSTEWGIEQTSILPQYKEFLTKCLFYTMAKQKVVILRFIQPGVCIWMMTALLGISIIQNNKAGLVAALTLFLFFGTLLLGPIALLRYIYPLALASPVIIASLCNVLEESKMQSDKK